MHFDRQTAARPDALVAPGWGLSIARTFAEKMGGKLSASSVLGEGSCFTLSISLATPAVEQAPLIINLPIQRDLHSPRPLLLVEDNPVNQMVIEGMLRTLQHTVVTVDNGKKALELLNSDDQQFSVILMDLHLPDIDGLTVFRRYLAACQSTGRRSLPCVALTASAFEADRQQCMDAGMQDFISKPVSRQSLQQSLDIWLQVDLPNH